uniref:Uncharacterized LOC100178688 n=1 Tax=Ciona intestinalis TaxID=7719 RepID=A0A1W5BBT9_CIOIN|nr:uncharacterized protein LOC100178688 [Ciona intestinalis]|eukprot:XP_026690549.1 uncharacterized protein LOC100178688 [Ciona intestinalis]
MMSVKLTSNDKGRCHQTHNVPSIDHTPHFDYNGSVEFTNLSPLPEQATQQHLSEDGNEVFCYYSADNTEQTILYYSGDESEKKKEGSPGETQYFRYQKDGRRHAMGTGTSIIDPSQGGKYQKQKKSRRTSSGSDNGGFETSAFRLGVKEKLRSSFDKINIRVPFKWSSSDKLTNKDTKQKSNRRSSDSVFNGLTSRKKLSTSPIDYSEEEVKRNERSAHHVYLQSRANSVDHKHDYVNISEIPARHLQTQARKPRYIDVERVPETKANCTLSDYYAMHVEKQYRETSLKPKHVPLKVEPNSPYASLLSESSGTLSSGTVQEKPESRISPTCTPHTTAEPPRLAPSGMLLADKITDGNIIRPTAFKPPKKTKNWLAVTPTESSLVSSSNPCPSSVARFSVSTTSNDSDSGRNSATSMLVGASNGSNFSCSGSEGYESARVSASTNHSASVPDSDQLFLSPKCLGDDVTTNESETSDPQTQQNAAVLRNGYNESDKQFQKVFEEYDKTRKTEVNELKQVYSKQLKSQARKSTQAQQRLQQQIDRLQEDKQQSYRRLAELEEKIKSMNEAIDVQMNGDIVDLRARLEESEWERQQKYGERCMLNRQFKDTQCESAQRASEIVALRNPETVNYKAC